MLHYIVAHTDEPVTERDAAQKWTLGNVHLPDYPAEDYPEKEPAAYTARAAAEPRRTSDRPRRSERSMRARGARR